MTRKEVFVRTENPQVIEWLEQQKNMSESIAKLLSDFVNGRIVYFKDNMANLKQEKLFLEVQNEKLELWRNLKHEFPNFTWEQKVNIMKGENDLQQPKLPSTKNDFGVCDMCGHEHTANPPHVCKNQRCMCGVNGVYKQ